MNQLLEQAKNNRFFLSPSLTFSYWKDIKDYTDQLLNFKITDTISLNQWLLWRSELDAVIEEEKAWRYINQSCHTDNKEYAEQFNLFIENVDQEYLVFSNSLNQKLITYCDQHPFPKEYEIFIRSIRSQLEIFSELNVKIQAELEIVEQKYSAITGAMTVLLDNRELTLQSAQNLLKSTNRDERRNVFNLIWSRRKQDHSQLDQLFDQLLEKRHAMAVNAGFNNYLEFRFKQLGRFDYSIKNCNDFHDSVALSVVDVVDLIHKNRKTRLGYDTLSPFDLEVDPYLKTPLKAFSEIEDLVSKTIQCFNEIDPEFGGFIAKMQQNGYLDLDSRIGKAPGGYNYPLYESNVPFIFMNATNNLRDLETMMHEGGHAIHSFLSSQLPLVYYKELPSEIAEVASMAMELISMEHWHHFFSNADELKRAKTSQLEGVISVLPWVATIDKFQHWLYTHPGHSIKDREKAWIDIDKQFSGSIINWSGLEDYKSIFWQKQIHLFQFPLYYIEYGIAQLGAIAIWKNYKENPKKTIEQYKSALGLGYSKTLPELYAAAGIEFKFTNEYINSLMQFVLVELENL